MNLSNWDTYDHYGYALFAVVVTFGAVAAIHGLMHRSPWAPWVRSLNGVVPPFINIINVLFGLTLAFLANDTWSAHDRTMNAVYKEADALRSLVVLASKLSELERTRVQAALTAYAQATVVEWPLLGQRSANSEVTAKADDLLTLIGSPAMGRTTEDNLQALMLRKVTDIRDNRDLRIGLSQTHINPLKWLSMAFFGLLTLLFVAVVHAENPRAA